MFDPLRAAGAEASAAGSSDWVAFAKDGTYPADEAHFLHFILHFFEESLTGQLGLDGRAFARWLATRRSQIESGQLVYIAHQLDFLVSVRSSALTDRGAIMLGKHRSPRRPLGAVYNLSIDGDLDRMQ